MRSNKFIILVLILATVSLSSLFGITVEEVFEKTLVNDDSTKSMKYKYEGAKKEKDMAMAGLYPSLSASLAYTDREYAIGSGGATRDEEYSGYRITFSQAIYNKKILESLDESELNVKASNIDLSIHQDKRLLEALSLFIDASIKREKVNFLNYKNKLYSANLKKVKKMLSHSLVPRSEYNKFLLDYNKLKIEIQQTKNDYEFLKFKLSSYIGEEISEIDEVVDFSKYDFNLGDEKELVSKNPDIKKYKLQHLISKQKVKTYEAEHYPSLQFQASYSTNESMKDDPNSLMNDYTDDRKMMLVLNVPIFNGWYYSSQADQAKLYSKSAEYEYKQQVVDTKDRLKELQFKKDIIMQNIQMYKENLELSKAYLESVNNGYKKKLRSIVDLHEAIVEVEDVRYKIKENMYEKLRIDFESEYLYGALEVEN